MSPPMTTIASGCEMNPPVPVIPSPMGVSARIVASAVIRIGRRRRVPPAIVASWALRPFSRYWLTRSTRTMAFVTTMPMSISTPMSEATPSGMPVTICRRIAPVAANGTEMRSSSGWRSDLKVATMTTYTIRMAASSASPSWLKASAWSVATPPRLARAAEGRSAASIASVTDAVACERLSVAGVTVTVAVRVPPSVVIEVGPWASSTTATSDSGTGPWAVNTCRLRSSSIVVGGSFAAR